MKICIDPGHGMSNRQHLKYDPGATSNGVAEAGIAMEWANCLRGILKEKGHTVVRTRVDDKDPAPVSRRDDIARAYGCERMLSLHCNAANGQANGTETFYRGSDDLPMAKAINNAVVKSLGTKDRGAKTEASSQHSSLAVMEFDKCWLLEIGFIDHEGDRAKMLDKALMQRTCEALADVITS